jgi:hypothetical protein
VCAGERVGKRKAERKETGCVLGKRRTGRQEKKERTKI